MKISFFDGCFTSLVKDKREYIDFFLIKNGRNFFKVDPLKKTKVSIIFNHYVSYQQTIC